jgi:hypothetical protein
MITGIYRVECKCGTDMVYDSNPFDGSTFICLKCDTVVHIFLDTEEM